MSRTVVREGSPKVSPAVLVSLIKEAKGAPSPASTMRNRLSCATCALGRGDEKTAKDLLAQAMALSEHFQIHLEMPPELMKLQ